MSLPLSKSAAMLLVSLYNEDPSDAAFSNTEFVARFFAVAFPSEPAKYRVDFSRIPENNNAEERILARQERIGGPVFDI